MRILPLYLEFRRITEIKSTQPSMTSKPSRVILLLVVLASFWLVLSGHFSPLRLTLGAVSCALVAWITLAAVGTGGENPASRIRWGRWCGYQPWLAVQILRSAVDVAVRILDPKLPISPVVTRVPADLPDLGKVIYANSVTLTPGTVSINLGRDEIIVHCLTREGADHLSKGEMYHRVRQIVRQP